jgi:hypothetical protein
VWDLLRSFRELVTAVRLLALDMRAQTLAAQEQTRAVQANSAVLWVVVSKLDKLIEKLGTIPDPDQISLIVTKEIGSMLQFKITLPAEPDAPNDIVGGELTVTIGSETPVVVATSKGQSEVTGADAATPFSGNQGDLVSASFVYLDDAVPPNRSMHPSAINGVELTDTIPPSDPGSLGLAVTAEV